MAVARLANVLLSDHRALNVGIVPRGIVPGGGFTPSGSAPNRPTSLLGTLHARALATPALPDDEDD